MTVRPQAVLAVVAMAAFFLSVDLTFVNVALPDIGTRFGASAGDLAWVVDAYTVALTSLLIPGAAVAERFGRAQVFLAGMGLFTAASVLAGLADSLGMLLAGRALMGVGAGLMLAPAIAITAMAFPPRERARALATWASAGALGLALGPVAGGLLVGSLGWRWAFLLPVPALLAAVVAGFMVLPRGRGPAGVPLDVVGCALALVGLAPVVAALIEAPRLGWASPVVVGAFIVGGAALVAFVVHERRSPAPAFDVRLLALPAVAGSALALFAGYVAFLGVLFLVTIELQALAGVGPVAYGLALVPMSVSYWVMSRVGAALARAGSPRLAVALGLACAALAFAVPALAPATVAWTIPALVLMGVGNGLIVPVAAALMLNASPMGAMSTASALSVVARFAGGAVGVAVIASAAASAPALAEGVTRGYVAGAALVALLAVGAGIALRPSAGVVNGGARRGDERGVDAGVV